MQHLLKLIINPINGLMKKKDILEKMNDTELLEIIKLTSIINKKEIGLIIDEVFSRDTNNQSLLDFKEKILNSFKLK
jgi:hypothetical protein